MVLRCGVARSDGGAANAVYRDLIQTSLLVDAKDSVLAVLLQYKHKTGGKEIRRGP